LKNPNSVQKSSSLSVTNGFDYHYRVSIRTCKAMYHGGHRTYTAVLPVGTASSGQRTRRKTRSVVLPRRASSQPSWP
jgi:hypothetical protein